MNLNSIAHKLHKAAAQARPTTQISSDRSINLDESYAIQSIVLSERYLEGNKLTGFKLGFTSRAKMEQMGVEDMIWGRLTTDMEYLNDQVVHVDRFIHPRAEPEIAFTVKKDIDKILSEDDIEEYIESYHLAVEIIDSRYENFKFSLADVIADNCSSAGYCIGDPYPTTTNIKNIEMSLSIDGKLVHSGNSNNILGNPLESLEAMSRLALSHGQSIKAGHIILAGAATPAVHIKGTTNVSAQAAGLGQVNIRVQ